MSIIIFLVILAVLIFVHELGHFIVAKKSGIRVDEFGIGFPPKIFSKKIGSTLYTLNIIPFGGFVKIFGEDPHSESISEADKPTSFYYKPKWIQALVLSAGVTFNVIFAWLLLSLGFIIGFPAPENHSNFGNVQNIKLVVTEVLPDSPAKVAGLIPGDTIISVSSGDITLEGSSLTREKVQETISLTEEGKVEIVYKRGNFLPQIVQIEPSPDIIPDKRAIGISMENIGTLKLPVHLALLEGARTTWIILQGTAIGLAGFLIDVLTFNSDLSEVSGPIGIAGIVGEAQTLGFVYLLSLVALISINLAIINILPFPALDGGRLFFLIIEAITRRPISPNFVRYANVLGFIFLILLMIVITGKDIFNLL